MPRVKAKKQSVFKSQLLLLVIVLLLLVCISTVATLMATGTIEIVPSDAEPVDNITDAESICTNQVKAEHGNMINAVSVDDFSSRLDESTGEFKMFYQLDMYRDASKKTGTQLFYVNCVVSAQKGVVSKLEYLEQQEFKGKPVRREHGNAFGF